eukprot:tig00000955_g5791.t1
MLGPETEPEPAPSAPPVAGQAGVKEEEEEAGGGSQGDAGFLHLLALHCDKLLKQSGPAEVRRPSRKRTRAEEPLPPEDAGDEADGAGPPSLASVSSIASSNTSSSASSSASSASAASASVPPGDEDPYEFILRETQPPEEIRRDGLPAASRRLPPLPGAPSAQGGAALAYGGKDSKDEFFRQPFMCERPVCPQLPEEMRSRLDAGDVVVKCTSSWGRDPRVVANRRHHLTIRIFQGAQPLGLAPFVRYVRLQPYMSPRACPAFRRIDTSGFKPAKCARVLEFRADENDSSVVRAKVQTMLKETDLAAWDIEALCFQVGLFAREGGTVRLLGWAMTEPFTSCSKQAVKEKQARNYQPADEDGDEDS